MSVCSCALVIDKNLFYFIHKVVFIGQAPAGASFKIHISFCTNSVNKHSYHDMAQWSNWSNILVSIFSKLKVVTFQTMDANI